MDGNDNNQAILSEARKAFAAEITAERACRDHQQTCWVCRWGFLFLGMVKCLTVEGLTLGWEATKVNANFYRPGVNSRLEPQAPSAEWLEEFFKR